MIKVGLTGGIGSGKSTIAAFFEVLGVPVYYADERAKFLIQHHHDLRLGISGLLGEEAYREGIYQRKWVADRVFKDNDLLQKLNELVHPAVAEDFKIWAQKKEAQSYIIREAALITSRKGLDKVIYVWCSEEERIGRVMKRDTHRTEKDIRLIFEQQPSEEKFREISDYIIDNEDELIIPQVLKIHDSLTS